MTPKDLEKAFNKETTDNTFLRNLLTALEHKGDLRESISEALKQTDVEEAGSDPVMYFNIELMYNANTLVSKANEPMENIEPCYLMLVSIVILLNGRYRWAAMLLNNPKLLRQLLGYGIQRRSKDPVKAAQKFIRGLRADPYFQLALKVDRLPLFKNKPTSNVDQILFGDLKTSTDVASLTKTVDLIAYLTKKHSLVKKDSLGWGGRCVVSWLFHPKLEKALQHIEDYPDNPNIVHLHDLVVETSLYSEHVAMDILVNGKSSLYKNLSTTSLSLFDVDDRLEEILTANNWSGDYADFRDVVIRSIEQNPVAMFYLKNRTRGGEPSLLHIDPRYDQSTYVESCFDIPYYSDGNISAVMLSKKDPIVPWLGYFSGCCQHLNNANGRDITFQALKTAEYGFLVFYDKDQEVFAQAMVWLHEDGSLVIDSIEAKLRRSRRKKIVHFLADGYTEHLKKYFPSIYLGIDRSLKISLDDKKTKDLFDGTIDDVYCF